MSMHTALWKNVFFFVIIALNMESMHLHHRITRLLEPSKLHGPQARRISHARFDM